MELSHLDELGAAQMVDVTEKSPPSGWRELLARSRCGRKRWP